MTEKQPPDDHEGSEWEEIKKVIQEFKRPKDWRKFLTDLDRIVEESHNREWLASLIKKTALWLVPVIIVWAAFKEPLLAILGAR